MSSCCMQSAKLNAPRGLGANRKNGGLWFSLLAFGSVAWIAGCASSPPPHSERWPDPPEPTVYLAPGDQIEVMLPFQPEFNSTQIVRPDWLISLQQNFEKVAACHRCSEPSRSVTASPWEQRA